MENLELPYGIKVLNATSLDGKYLNGDIPYTGVTEVNGILSSGVRHIGLTVNILGIEYWYANGITDLDLIIKSGGSGSGERIEKEYTQNGHGFNFGDIVAYSGTSFIKAIADGTQDAEVVGLVSDVPDVNTFTVVFSGYIEGISGLTLSASTTYFLSISVAGALSSSDTEVFDTISKPVLTTLTDNEALIFQYRGFLVESGATVGGKEVVKTTIPTVTVLDINVDTLFVSSGTTLYNLPSAPLEGSELIFVDAAGTAGTASIILDGGVITIYDFISTTAEIGSNFGSITLVFNGTYWNVTAFV